ncbi:MAG: MFS transporter [Euryarchaeota archaeon]|nr:MFS transporter [Euryarchaeota archaeon]MBT7937614.1 MFS transporter [Euryarchaeota archaeon]
MSWVQFPPPAFFLILILAFASPAILSEVQADATLSQEITSTKVNFNASGRDQLSTSGEQRSGGHSGTVSPGGTVLKVTFTSNPFYYDLTPTNDEWTASMYLSGTGNVRMKVILETDTGVIGEADSLAITLNGNPSEVVVTGSGFSDALITQLDRLTLTYEVSGNSPASVDMRWGEELYPSHLELEADFVRPTEVRVANPGEVFDDDDGDYGRRNIMVSADIETKVDLKAMMSQMILRVKDGDADLEILEPEVDERGVGRYTVNWLIPEIGNGSNISVVVAWLDDDGVVRWNSTTWEWVFPVASDDPLLSQGTLMILQFSTAPLLLLVGYWLFKRNRIFCSEDGELKELEYRAFNNLIFSTCCFFIAVLNIMFFIVNHHIRNLGAAESQIILHLGVLALVYGAAGPLWGRIADKTGNRRSLVKIAGIIGVLASLLMAPMGLWAFFGMSMLLMAALGVQRLHFALASEWFEEQKGEAIGILYAFGYLVTAVFAVVDGSIYQWLGIWATCTTSALLIAAGTISFLRIDTDRTETIQKKVETHTSSLMKFDSKWVKWCLLGAMLVAIPRGAVVLTSPRYIETRGFDIAMTSLFESWAILALIILYVIIGKVCDRHGAERVLLASAIAYGLLWSFFSLGLSPWMSVAIYLIPIVPLLLVSNDSLLSRFTTKKERNRGLGMASAATYIGQAIGIALVVSLMAWFESSNRNDVEVYHLAYQSNIPLFALAVAVTAWLSTRIRKEKLSNE